MAIKFFRTRDKYGCFSNFSRHSVWYENYTWPTTEHYFQAQKYAGLPGPAIERYNAIRIALTPRIAADLGRDRSIPMRSDWEQVKDDVMRQCVLQKFQTHRDIREILLGTYDEELIEDSPWDSYWGIGSNGDGKNILGKILMETRKYLSAVSNSI